MVQDVHAAYEWIGARRELDLSRVALVGASVGCSVALHYTTHDRSVDGVVCMTPGTSYLGIDSIAHAGKYGPRPLLLLASEPEKAAAMELGQIAPAATVKMVPGIDDDPMALHGTRMFGTVGDIETEITNFLIGAVGPPPTKWSSPVRGEKFTIRRTRVRRGDSARKTCDISVLRPRPKPADIVRPRVVPTRSAVVERMVASPFPQGRMHRTKQAYFVGSLFSSESEQCHCAFSARDD